MTEVVKVANEDFWRKESLKIDKSKIKDYFIWDMVEREVKALNRDIDYKYKTWLLDLNWNEKISDNDKNKLISSLNMLVKGYNEKIWEAIKEYWYASSANEKEIKQLLSSAWLNTWNIKIWNHNVIENWIWNIAYYAWGAWIDKKMKDAWL